MKRTVIICILTVLLAACSTPVEGIEGDIYTALSVLQTAGTVTVERESNTLDARAGMRLFNLDTVKTAAASSAWLTLDEHKAAQLGEQTVLRVDRRSSGFALTLTAGEITARIDRPLDDGESFNVYAGNLTMGVRGTVFTVRLEDDIVTVEVERGVVAVLDAAGEEVAVLTGGESEQFNAVTAALSGTEVTGTPGTDIPGTEPGSSGEEDQPEDGLASVAAFSLDDLISWGYPPGLSVYEALDRGIIYDVEIEEDSFGGLALYHPGINSVSNSFLYSPNILFDENRSISGVSVRDGDSTPGPRGSALGMSLESVLALYRCDDPDAAIMFAANPSESDVVSLYHDYDNENGITYDSMIFHQGILGVRLNYTVRYDATGEFQLYYSIAGGVVTEIYAAYIIY